MKKTKTVQVKQSKDGKRRAHVRHVEDRGDKKGKGVKSPASAPAVVATPVPAPPGQFTVPTVESAHEWYTRAVQSIADGRPPLRTDVSRKWDAEHGDGLPRHERMQVGEILDTAASGGFDASAVAKAMSSLSREEWNHVHSVYRTVRETARLEGTSDALAEARDAARGAVGADENSLAVGEAAALAITAEGVLGNPVFQNDYPAWRGAYQTLTSFWQAGLPQLPDDVDL